jgi:hypothetical protein
VARLFILFTKTARPPRMKTFGVVVEENKKSTRKKMPKNTTYFVHILTPTIS